MFMPCRTLLSQFLSGPLLKSVLIFLKAITNSSVASDGAGACDEVIVPARSAALTAAGIPFEPRMVWKVVASEPTLMTTHFFGL